MKKVFKVMMKLFVFVPSLVHSASGKAGRHASAGAARENENKNRAFPENGKKTEQKAHAPCKGLGRDIRASISWEMLMVLSVAFSGLACVAQ